MGPAASGGQIQAGSTFARIGDTVVVPDDECWTPDKENTVHCSIVLVGGVHLFIDETSDSARFAGTARTAVEPGTSAGDRSR
jgi:hypothetical protein